MGNTCECTAPCNRRSRRLLSHIYKSIYPSEVSSLNRKFSSVLIPPAGSMSDGEVLSPAGSPDPRSDQSPARPENFGAPFKRQRGWERDNNPNDQGFFASARRPSDAMQTQNNNTTYPRSASRPTYGIDRRAAAGAGPSHTNGAAANGNVSKHHWYALCGLRNSMTTEYEALAQIVNDLRVNKVVSERAIDSVVRNLGDKLCCISCGCYCPTMDSNVFILTCSHVICKPTCFQKIGARCPVNCPRPQHFRGAPTDQQP